MKRICVLLSLFMVFSLALTGCTGRGQVPVPEPETTAAAAPSQAETEPESAAGAAEETTAAGLRDADQAAAGMPETETAADETAAEGTDAAEETEGEQPFSGAGVAEKSDDFGAMTEEVPEAMPEEEEIELDEGLPEDGGAVSETDEDGYPIPDRKLIAIDPGHQAHANSGQEPVGPGSSKTKAKVSSGTAGDYTGASEYQLNLDVALKLKAELLSRGYDVLMIRESNDVDISNVERATMANDAHADAFIRIHADGSEDHSSHGCFTICQTSSNPYNADIYPECNALAESVLEGLVASTGAYNRGVMRSDTYSGINWSKVPVTIVEMGFMSNKEEDELMQTEDYQNKIARGLADGIDIYFRR